MKHLLWAGAKRGGAFGFGLHFFTGQETVADASVLGAMVNGLHKRLRHKWGAWRHLAEVHLAVACNFMRCIVLRLAIDSAAKSCGLQLIMRHFVTAASRERVVQLVLARSLIRGILGWLALSPDTTLLG